MSRTAQRTRHAQRFGPTLSEVSPMYRAAYDQFEEFALAEDPRAAEWWEKVKKLGDAIRNEMRAQE